MRACGIARAGVLRASCALYGSKTAAKMIYTTLDNFYLTEEQLREDSPSRRDGIDQDT